VLRVGDKSPTWMHVQGAAFLIFIFIFMAQNEVSTVKCTKDGLQLIRVATNYSNILTQSHVYVTSTRIECSIWMPKYFTGQFSQNFVLLA